MDAAAEGGGRRRRISASAGRPDAARDGARRRAWVGPAVLGLAGLALGWAIVVQALIQVAPTRLALAVAPDSPSATADAAQDAYTAKQTPRAAALARRSLALQPFDVVALRVAGLADAARNGADHADQTMTLAGDWSLRDQLSQAWLFGQRLRHRAYGSAFAHADALMRMDSDILPPMFKLFDEIVSYDPKALGALGQRLASGPPWRQAYFESLGGDPQRQLIAAELATGLAASPHPATRPELSALLANLVVQQRYALADQVWRRVGGAEAARAPADGGFNAPQTPDPFGWRITGGEGATVQILEDGEERGERALRVDYDGYSNPTLVKAFMALGPGPRRLTGRLRSDLATGADQLGWVVSCADDGRPLAEARGPASAQPGAWASFSETFTVPPTGCAGQWLTLAPYPGERPNPTTVWYTDLAVAGS